MARVALSVVYQNKILALTVGQRAACIATLDDANIGFEFSVLGWASLDNATAQGIIDTPGQWLVAAKAQKQTVLDEQFDNKFDLAKFIRGGNSTTITANNVGTFLATITNNYRSLRASIAAAATVDAVVAIDLTAGWPGNP